MRFVIFGAGAIETDYLNGEIALLGRLHGVPTPVNSALCRIAGRYARQGRAPGELDPRELLAVAA
jgi:2-dehydropantoate 2-reductase